MAKLAQNLRLQCRLSSTALSLVHPDKIFTNIPPLPQPSPQPILPVSSQTPSTVFQWREAKELERSHAVLIRFQTALRSVHKHKVTWPADESVLSDLPFNKYLTALLQPTADLFNQLRSLEVMKKPVECINIELGEFIYGVTFLVEANRMWTGTPPIVLALNEELFDSDGKIGSRVEYAISKAVEYNPSVTSIIVTNFNQIVVLCPPHRGRKGLDPTFEKILTDRPTLALRVLSSAYLYIVAPSDSLINMPPPIIEVDERLVLPEGPQNNPNYHLLSDEEVFATRHCHSDFDLVMLVRDRDRALQFFRWKEHVQQNCSKIVARPHDTLVGATNNLGHMFIPASRPIYSYDPSEIPADTAEHLESIQSESPLVSYGVADSFRKSKTFTLEVQNVIAEGSKRGICSVYKCQLTSIDNESVSPSSPPLCLKLFDDRFQVLEKPDPIDDEIRYNTLHWWFDKIAIAEDYALAEYFAYDKLRPVQGSVVPWFYGIHQFTLPNGMILYGLLMEYIDGHKLTPDFIHNISVDGQIKLIKSCRHASRVLDVADVAQRDWHLGQILICTIPQTDTNYAVLIDFGLTTQTWYAEEPNLLMNYYGALSVLSSTHGQNWQFAWNHFGEPDDWDPIQASRLKISGELALLNARDMFPYISSV